MEFEFPEIDIDVSQWLLMRHNLIFLGMHFGIAKRMFLQFKCCEMKLTSFIVYANSLLATYVYPRCAAIITKFAPSRLNMRKRLRVDRMYSSERDHHNILTPLPTPINKSHFSVRRLTRLSNTVGVICVLMNDL